MRLHRLELSAFLAFPGHEVVDFDELGRAGLFLLHGRTGAGKTSLLDAVCFALYGDVPGVRSGGARLRSDHARPDVPTSVTLEATLRGRRIRVTRAPEQERPKRRGDGVTTDPHAVHVVRCLDDGGEQVLATRHDEATRELGDLLGMTREQFCQVVLLPQGGFARFLHAGSDERDHLLRELFDVGRFADVELWLRDRRADAERGLGTAMGAVRDAVSRAAQAADAEPPEGWVSDPAGAAGWLENLLVVAEASGTTAADAAQRAESSLVEAEAKLAAAAALAAQQAQAAAARRELEAWEAGREARDAAAERLAAARRAAPAQAHVEHLRARAEAAAEAGRAAAEAVAAARDAGVEISRPEPELDGRLFDASALDAPPQSELLRTAAAALRGDAGATKALLPRERELRDREAEVAGLEEEARRTAAEATALARAMAAARDRLATQATAARERLAAARDAHVSAREEHAALLERRLEGVAAELAGRLAAGEPCAVCGSLEHPSPAPAPEGGLVDEARVRGARERAEGLGRAREAAEGELAALETRLATATAIAGDEPAVDAGADGPDVPLAEMARRKGEAEVAAARAAADARQRSAALEADREAVDAARAGADSIAERVAVLLAAADAAERAGDALDDADRLTREADLARATALAAVSRAGFGDIDALRAAAREPAEQAELEASVRAWDEGLSARRAAAARDDLAEAAARPAPDVATLEAAAAQARSQAEQARSDHAISRRRQAELRELRGRLESALEAAAPARERFELARELSDLASGGIGNRLRMRLSAYVLAARLEAVAAAATVRLSSMTGGRYALEHADDDARGNRRGGLDLRVIDAWTGRDRAPSSLSGGETFLASLALALGLADVVTAEAGGSRLETLFVDEGFGSLDDEGTLDEVLAVLDELRDGGRAVGIVSHVAELRARIPAQLRVERGRSGSRVLRPAAALVAE